MKFFIRITLLLGVLSYLSCNTNNEAVFNEILISIKKDNFFKAKERYELKGDELSNSYQQYTKAILNNAFNQVEASEKEINALFDNKVKIPDTLQFNLYKLRYDNAIKLYNYKEAKEAIHTILSNYKKYLDNDEVSDFENSLKIWSALENINPQQVDIKQGTTLKMKKDIAGLNTLKVSAFKDSLNFIFDTGANLSTTSSSVAEKFNMEVIPVEIEVETITETKVFAQLAVCKKLTMGNIDIYNVIFLVLPDEALSFPQINYQIYGILGYPVIEALEEIQITQDGNFIVPLENSTFPENSNMAMDGLTPLIYLNHKHFTFDTGADNTMFYEIFYQENRAEIEKQYQSEKISFGGAGGKSEFEGYKIDYTFYVGDKEVNLKNISLLKEKIKEDETVYGNIGQDLIQQFNSMTLNFDQMFIRFE